MRLLAGRFVVALLLFLAAGCFQGPESRLDEEKDPHYLAGRECVIRRDQKGAIEAFEKALDANPRSAAAHFELGVLYEDKNYARAIYHYERHLELNPNSSKAEVVKTRIATCKLELAKVSSFSVVSKDIQKETDRLRQENESLKAQLAQMAQRLTNLSIAMPAPVSNRVASIPSTPLVATNPTPAPQARRSEPPASRGNPPPAVANPSTPSSKTHVVKAGETPAVIARRYGISLSTLLAANPGLEPRRMRVGQVLKIPSGKP